MAFSTLVTLRPNGLGRPLQQRAYLLSMFMSQEATASSASVSNEGGEAAGKVPTVTLAAATLHIRARVLLCATYFSMNGDGLSIIVVFSPLFPVSAANHKLTLFLPMSTMDGAPYFM